MPNNLKKKNAHVGPGFTPELKQVPVYTLTWEHIFCDREFRTSVSMHATLLVVAVDYFYNHNLVVGDTHAAAEGSRGSGQGYSLDQGSAGAIIQHWGKF